MKEEVGFSERRIKGSSNKLMEHQIMKIQKLSNEFMEKILQDSAWKALSEEYPWTEQQLEKFKENVSWKEISKNRNIVWTISMLEKFKKNVDWTELSGKIGKDMLTEDFIEQFKSYWNWTELSGNSDLDLSFQLIDKFIDYWDWNEMINGWDRDEFYTIEFLERYINKIPSSALQDSDLWEAVVKLRAKGLKQDLIILNA